MSVLGSGTAEADARRMAAIYLDAFSGMGRSRHERARVVREQLAIEAARNILAGSGEHAWVLARASELVDERLNRLYAAWVTDMQARAATRAQTTAP